MEVRVATVEKRLRRLEVEGEDFRRQLVALLQGIRDTEADLQNVFLADTSVTYEFRYCTNNLIVASTGETVTVTLTSSGQTDSGVPNVAGDLGLSYPHLSDGTYAFTSSIASGRYATFSGSFTISGGNPTGVAAVKYVPATGYACLPFCPYPMKQSLTLSDPNIDKGAGDTFALTYQASSASPVNFGAPFGTTPSPTNQSFWYAVRSETYGNCPALGCSSVGATPTLYVLTNSNTNQLKVQIYIAATGSCPDPAGSGYVNAYNWLCSSCPPSSTSLQTYTFPVISGTNAAYCGTPASALTVTET